MKKKTDRDAVKALVGEICLLRKPLYKVDIACGGSARDGHNDHKRTIADVLAEHEIPQGSILTATGTRTVTYAVPGGERRTFDLPSGIGPRMMPERV